jgi:hypothetical protein
MRNIQKLIDISQLDIEDKKERLIIELAILENKDFNKIKEMSLEAIERLITKHQYLYSNPIPKNTFSLNGVNYALPITLYGLPYGVWEDIETVNNNDSFGTTFWEKFPFILYILTYGKDYVQDDASNNIMTESDKFNDISIEDALAVSSFFLLLKMPLLKGLRTYIKLMINQTLKTTQTSTKMKFLTKLKNFITRFGERII